MLPGDHVAALADELAAHGADRVTVVEHEALAQFSADGWLAALAPVLKEAKPMLTLAPDSGYGRAWLPRLSARWRIPMATSLHPSKVIEDGYPEVYRVSHSGKLHERQIWARGTTVDGDAVRRACAASVAPVPGRACRDRTRSEPDARSVHLPRPDAAHTAARSARSST